MSKIGSAIGTAVGIGLLSLVGLGFMALTGTGFAIVNDGNRGIMKTGTKYEMEAILPGYHFFIPFYQSMVIKPIRPILVNYSVSEGNRADQELLKFEPALKGLDRRGIPISLALSIEVKPNAEKLPEMYREDGDFETAFYKKVLQANREAVQQTLSKFEVDTIMSKRAEVEKILTDLLRTRYAKNPYFTLVTINLKDIIVPEKIRKKQLEVQAAKQDALISEQLIIKAENEAKSVAAAARGIANRKRIEAQGIADAIVLKAEAQAKANELIGKSLTEMILKNNAIQKWNGVKSKVQAGNSGLIIDLGTVK